jgi:hypothetical protein
MCFQTIIRKRLLLELYVTPNNKDVVGRRIMEFNSDALYKNADKSHLN